ncbi:MAG: class I SAM-dependent methyltransferase [Bacillaceae bacterium]|nr:class I SAM-dependent methyltransferase [Bacillaceae bacterium]
MSNGRFVLTPSREMRQLFKQKAREISDFIHAAYRKNTLQPLIEYVADKSIQLFMEVNQYLDFTREDHHQLQRIYEDLFERVYMIGKQEKITDADIDQLFNSHYKHLQTFLLDSNGNEIFKKYRESPHLFKIENAEYSPEFQMRLLNIDPATIKQPVLDIGCGQQASLVLFLREQGIEAYGMDRHANNIGIFKVNWLEYEFVPDTWGTIVSHMAFSNHFMHHHLRTDGDYEMYAKKYMEILKALKSGGRFLYAPALPFMEDILLRVSRHYVVDRMGHATAVIKLK